ncbi:MAG TPA: hypothetical protein VJV03_04350 [Pyrinomonadaceae bacterium]|nr:hypothetical protein [Pyrinomonadaceae bacterium]
MKKDFLAYTFLLVFISFQSAQGQTVLPSPSPAPDDRPRTYYPPVRVQTPAPATETQGSPAGQAVTPSVGVTPPPRPPAAGPTATERHETTPGVTAVLPPSVIHSRITEAVRLLRSRPVPTAFNSPAIDVVTVAALDRSTSRIHLVPLYKPTFLKKGAEATMTSSLGVQLNVRILRANGVNTAVAIFDPQGRALVPLVVQYPIERNGVFREMAYYTSVHPALFSPELARSGQAYVRTMLDLAVKRLRERGKFISPQIVDVAERLCLVEHVDHDRFRNENRLALYQEIFSLFALNQLETYRYSVSSAGAGGMVQMIPWAYNLMKTRHPGVGLIPDFVVGMRTHSNALQAMLLYMQDTWNDLSANEDVQYALRAKLATQTELLAAGYNSNAARLPLYIRRGGASWRYLIPRETQMYLQIYKSVEGLIPQKPHATPVTQTRSAKAKRNS